MSTLKPGSIAAKDMGPREWAKWCREQQTAPPVGANYADDTEAAAAGIRVGEWYHTNGTAKVRLT